MSLDEGRTRPTVPEVIDMESGIIIPVADIFSGKGATQHKQRMADETARIRGGKVRYHCPLCHSQLAIRAYADRSFYFRHPNDPSAKCPYRYDSKLTPDQINAMKYDGAKESMRHKKIKEMLEISLSADKYIAPNSVKPETTISSREGEWNTWRRPDIQAQLNGKLFAFEIQLSTTFLTVIAGRREFYLKNGGLLFWIFAEEFLNQEEMRFTERDVFYNNNSNLFYLTSDTVANSVKHHECHLMCRWEEPRIEDDIITTEWREKEIRLSELQLDFKGQRAFYFDYDQRLAALENELQNIQAQKEECARIEREAEEARLQAIQQEQQERQRAWVEKLESNPHLNPYLNNSPLEEGGLTSSKFAIEDIVAKQRQRVLKFEEKVLLEYAFSPPEQNTSENFGNYWIRAGLNPESEEIQRIIWKHYRAALAAHCPELKMALPSSLPREYRQLFNALYSLREGVVIGLDLENLRAVENLIFNSYKMFYRYFAFGIKAYRRDEELKSMVAGSTCNKHIKMYKANRNKTGYQQNHMISPLVLFLFPELDL